MWHSLSHCCCPRVTAERLWGIGVKGDKFGVCSITQLIVQVASALREMHEVTCVAHLDIKPENILYVIDEDIKDKEACKIKLKLSEFQLAEKVHRVLSLLFL